MEVPWLFVHFSDAVSLSQSRRAAGFAPLPFALARRRSRCSRARLVRAAARVRRRDRAAAALAGRLRLRPAPRRARARDVDRARRRRASRSSPALVLPAAACPSTTRSARCGGARVHVPVFVHGALASGARQLKSDPLRALAAARAQPAHEGAEGLDRDRADQDQLPRRRKAPRLHRRRAGHARREHEGERSVRRACGPCTTGC